MTRASRLAGALFAGLFLAFHLPFLPSSLEDLDSINFALGLRDFDVSQHQPHPPGYPVFMVAAKAVHALGVTEVHALSLVSVAGGALGVIGLLLLFGELDRDRTPGPFTWMAVLVAAASPLYWMTAARPLSDAAGLGAVLVVQGLMLSASSTRALAIAAGLAGVAAGIRSQVVWLTVPLLALSIARLPAVVRVRGLTSAAVAYVAGVLLWFIPLVMVSGGPVEYWRVFVNQGTEDLSGVVMLATMPSLGLLVDTLGYTFIAPWGQWWLAVAVLALACVGTIAVLARQRVLFMTLAVAFGPYLIFHLLFQEAITTRYGLPLVIPVVYLAVRGASLMPQSAALATGLAIGVSAILVDDRALYGYAQMDAPAFRMLGDMAKAREGSGGSGGSGGSEAPVLAVHRREEYDLRRPLQWVGDALPPFAARLPAPPKHEWLELVKYWNSGGRAPVWFVADPLRTDLALVRHDGRPTLYRWPFRFTTLVGGARPNEVDWHRIDPPDWYLGEGWSLTPETAGTAREERRGPGFGPITAWVRRSPQVTLMVGGRNLSATGATASLRVKVSGQLVDEAAIAPGFFLRTKRTALPVGSGDYVDVTIESDNADLAIEQFDAQPPGRVVFGFGDGWNELEHDPSTGRLWRWSSDRSTLRVRAEGHALALTLTGDVEAASSSHITIRAGTAVAAEFDIGRSFGRTVIIPAAMLNGEETLVTIETSAWYVPAERSGRSRDARRLGLKLYECRLTQAS